MLTILKAVTPPEESVYLKLVDTELVNVYFTSVAKFVSKPVYIDLCDDDIDADFLIELFSDEIDMVLYDDICEHLASYSKKVKPRLDADRKSRFLKSVDSSFFNEDSVVRCLEDSILFYKLFTTIGDADDASGVFGVLYPFMKYVQEATEKILHDMKTLNSVGVVTNGLLSYIVTDSEIYVKLEIDNV